MITNLDTSNSREGAPWRFALVLLLPLCAYLLRLGAAPLFDVDEGAFSEATREMFERGDFLFTYLNGQPRFDKPILIYWLQAAAVALFGNVEWAYRLPSALAAVLWCWAVWGFARPRFGADAALVALAVAASALGPFLIGRAATADGLLNLLLALALFDAWRYLESGARAPLLRTYVWVGLGFLTKGPIAILVPGAVTVLYLLSRSDWRLILRAGFDPIGWLLFALIVVPWYAHALATHGQDFIDGFFLRHNVERFTGTLEGHAGSLFYYVLIVPLLLLPWTGPLFASLTQVREDVRGGLRRYLWLWAGFVVVFFSLSGTKLPHYALYGATPLFLLIALHAERLRRDWLHLLPAGLLLTVLAALPWILAHLAAGEAGNAFYRAQLARALEVLEPTYLYLTCTGLGLWLILLFLRQVRLTHRLIAASVLQTLVLAAAAVPFVGELLQGSVKDAAHYAAQQGAPVVSWRFSTAPSFSVYREAITPSRAPEIGELALVRISHQLLPEEQHMRLETVFERGGVRLVRRTD